VVLPLVLLVFFVFPLVDAVQAGAAFACGGREERNTGTQQTRMDYLKKHTNTMSIKKICRGENIGLISLRDIW